eukprot:gb/GECG01016536.1/.p1 GENE.gb/GECG01016536.1/~~gb/GECG01016536.1/.p1  ORF type:complete len:371 (+),score=27.75 gb/GECG01016536.1/:1-1113(+)
MSAMDAPASRVTVCSIVNCCLLLLILGILSKDASLFPIGPIQPEGISKEVCSRSSGNEGIGIRKQVGNHGNHPGNGTLRQPWQKLPLKPQTAHSETHHSTTIRTVADAIKMRKFTVVSGYFFVESSPKNSPEYYAEEVPRALNWFASMKTPVVFYHNIDVSAETDNPIFIAIKQFLQNPDVKGIYLPLSELPGRRNASFLANYCLKASKIKKKSGRSPLCSRRCSGLSSLAKRSLEAYTHVMAIWLSKLSFVMRASAEAPNSLFSWMDCGVLRRVPNVHQLAAKSSLDLNAVNAIPHHGMYNGKRLLYKMSLLIGTQRALLELKQQFETKLGRVLIYPQLPCYDDEIILSELLRDKSFKTSGLVRQWVLE